MGRENQCRLLPAIVADLRLFAIPATPGQAVDMLLSGYATAFLS